ncbi:MAG: hypothetical protein SGBAC_004919 [Bacillariaceae sp.]
MMMIPMLVIGCLLALICLGHAFSSPLIQSKGSLPCLYRRNFEGLGTTESTKCEYVHDKADYSEMGASLLECLENGQVSEDIAFPGLHMSPITPETTKTLQEIEQGQDLGVPKDEWQVSFEEEAYAPPSYLSKYSTTSSSRWVRVVPQLQDLFMEAFQAVVGSHRLLNESSTVQLSPYDLFHGHIFRRSSFYQNRNGTIRAFNCTDIQTLEKEEEEEAIESGSYSAHHQLGILFHCCEYPAVDNAHGILENISLGHHQIGSTCQPTLEEWKFRNVLWLVGWWQLDDDDGECCTRLESPLSLQPHIWLLNGSAPEISQLQMDGSEFGPQSPNTVWEGFLIMDGEETTTEKLYGANKGDSSKFVVHSGLVADIYHGMEDGSIWCEM